MEAENNKVTESDLEEHKSPLDDLYGKDMYGVSNSDSKLASQSIDTSYQGLKDSFRIIRYRYQFELKVLFMYNL